MRRGLVIGILGLLAVAAATGMWGCGGSDSGSSLSKAEFVRKGNEICRKAEKERLEALEATARKYGIGPGQLANPTQQQKIILSGVPSYEGAAEDLQEMAPDGEEEKVDVIAEAMQEAADKVRANPGTAVHSGVQFKEADELTESYGLKDCSI